MVEEIGRILRQAREEQGLTFEKIQSSTKIRQRYLVALEEGQYGVIPGEAYVRGFLRNYAIAVGLDPRRIMDLYEEGRSPREASSLAPPRPEKAPSKRRAWWPWMLAAVAVIAVGVTIFLAFTGWPPFAKPLSRTEPAPDDLAPADQSVETQPAIQGVQIELSFTERCWISVKTDGKKVYEGTENPGDKRSWSALSVIDVTFGNAGGVRVEVNGSNLGVLGLHGENLTRRFVAP